MAFPVFEDYLTRLPKGQQSEARLWLNDAGWVQGKFFDCLLTSAFQPVRLLPSGKTIGYEAFTQSDAHDTGLSVWRLLDSAASDDESIELDRLCRVLHSINFFRQATPEHTRLFLSVHERLLAAVNGNHGLVFRHVLDGLGLPPSRVILQLPSVPKNQSWVLAQVAESYRRNGFKFAINASNLSEAQDLLATIQPHVIKIDANDIANEGKTLKLIADAHALGIVVVFKRLESTSVFNSLSRIASSSQLPTYAQGHLWDVPSPILNNGKAEDLNRTQSAEGVHRNVA
jgi:EAL domain-containing protein (putative c-di-GMP-specific phosphodiesterase class I)